MTDSTTTPEDVFAFIQEEMKAINVAASDEIQMSSSWDDLDVDSLEVIELVAALEDRFGVDMSEENYDELRGAGEVARRVSELLGRR